MSEKVNVCETPLTKEYFDIQMAELRKENGNGFTKVFEYMSINANEWNKSQRVQDRRLDKLEKNDKKYTSKRDIIILSVASCAGVVLLVLLIYEKFIG
jgi:hypothetical protein